jgi:8-oxo-dGTP pyrophosphatase MutT (NUDIX family)
VPGTPLYTAGLVVIQQNKLLLAYSNRKKAWYLPGGKIDAGETALTALQREITEELGIQLDTKRLHYYLHITAPAYGEDNRQMEQSCYRYELTEQVQAGNEISDVRLFSPADYAREPAQVPGVLQLFKQLLTAGLLTNKPETVVLNG